MFTCLRIAVVFALACASTQAIAAAPIANTDDFPISEDAGWVQLRVLANDTDNDGPSTLSVHRINAGAPEDSDLQAPAHGEIRFDWPYTYVEYRPYDNSCENDAFQYTAYDGTLTDTLPYDLGDGAESNIATVYVEVLCVDDPPEATSDSFTTSEDTPATFDVLLNDLDADGGPARISSSTDGTHGTVTLDDSNSDYHKLIYSPDPDWFGEDIFSYTVANGGQATVTVRVVPVNDAPTLLLLEQISISVTEDDASAAIALSAGAAANDVDDPSVPGFAVTGVIGNGKWQWQSSPDSEWITILKYNFDSGAVLLLPGFADAKVRYVPDERNGETATLAYVAWDNTQGVAGNYATAPGVFAGSWGSLSEGPSALVTVSVFDVNDAPTIDSGVTTFTPITEDDMASAGDSVSDLLAGANYEDVDLNALRGMAIVGMEVANGTWQYQLDGSSWIDIDPAVSDANRLLLTSAGRIRFVPGTDSPGSTMPSISFRAWDRTTGTPGTYYAPEIAPSSLESDIGATNGSKAVPTIQSTDTGGPNAFSSVTATIEIEVIAVNDAPVLTPASPSLGEVSESDSASSAVSVASFLVNSVTDVDADAVEGVAIFEASSPYGTWQYSINDGSDWSGMGVVSESSVLLLRAGDLVRFVPGTVGTGEVETASFGYYAWDQSDENPPGSKVSASLRGGTTAFSTLSDTASIDVTPANEPPVAVDDHYEAVEDKQLVIPVGKGVTFNDTDPNDDSPLGVKDPVSVTATHGTLALAADGSFTFDPDPDYCGEGDDAASFSYTATDEPGVQWPPALDSEATATVTIDIACVNDKPDFEVVNVTKDEDTGEHLNVAVTVDGSFDPGPDNESDQTIIECKLDKFLDSNTPAVLTGEPTALPNDDKDGCVITFDTQLHNYSDGANITFDLQIRDSGGAEKHVDSGGAEVYSVDLSDKKEVTITIEPINDAPDIYSVAATAQTVQYSDNIDTVTIVVRDVDSEDTTLLLTTDGNPSNIMVAELVENSCQAWPVDHPYTGDGRECTFTMNGQVLVPGDESHVITFTPNDTETNGSTGSHTLTVAPEEAAVYLDNKSDANPVAVEVTDSETDPTNQAFTMYFWAYERNSQPFGDLADIGDPNGSANAVLNDFNSTNVKGTITFSAVGPGSGHSQACTPTDVVDDTDMYGDYMVFQCAIKAGVLDVNTYEVEAKVDGLGTDIRYFYGIDEDAFVVFDPNAGFTTGGGWFYFPDTGLEEGALFLPPGGEEGVDEIVNPCAPYPGDKTNFGFTMKYNNKGTKVQGSGLVMRHTMVPVEIEPGDWQCLEGENYRVKSNALYGLALSESEEPPFGYASFAGKATYREPGLDNDGNHTFFIYVEDYGDKGCNQDPDKNDRFWIEVWDKDDIRVMDPGMGFNGASNAEAIECGNIVVPFESGGGGGGHGKGKKGS